MFRAVYSIPRVEDLFSTLVGRITFTKLDMSKAYQSGLPVETEQMANSHEKVAMCSLVLCD